MAALFGVSQTFGAKAVYTLASAAALYQLFPLSQMFSTEKRPVRTFGRLP